MIAVLSFHSLELRTGSNDHGRLQACDLPDHGRTARRPRRRRQGLRCGQGDRQAGLRHRARHPQRLEQGAGRAEGGGGQGRQEQGQAPAARQGQAAGAGPLPVGDLLCRRELSGPRQRNGGEGQPAAAARPAHARARILAFHQGLPLDLQSGRDRQDLHLFAEDGLGGRAGGGDRQAGQERARSTRR